MNVSGTQEGLTTETRGRKKLFGRQRQTKCSTLVSRPICICFYVHILGYMLMLLLSRHLKSRLKQQHCSVEK